MDFFFFIVLNGVLFLRPGDLLPELEGLPIYYIVIIICLLTSSGPIVEQLQAPSLGMRPITACILGLFVSVVLSNVARGDFLMARLTSVEFLKIVLYYLLLVAVLNTPARLSRFLTWLIVFAAALAVLSLMHYHGLLRLPALGALEREELDAQSGQVSKVMQLQGMGMFADPNDFCCILVAGIVLCLWRLLDRRANPVRVVWLFASALLLYAVLLTRSRGGFLALMAGLMTVLITRFGWRRALPLGTVVLPALFLISGGRQTRLSTGEDTAQERLHLWHEGLLLLARTPVTGIGAGKYSDALGLVAHNSFIHGFTELGLLGGTFFFGVFYLAVSSLRRLRDPNTSGTIGDLEGLRPFLLALLAGTVTSFMSLTRNYTLPTYIVPGVITAYLANTAEGRGAALPCFNLRMVTRLFITATICLIGLYLFMRVNL